MAVSRKISGFVALLIAAALSGCGGTSGPQAGSGAVASGGHDGALYADDAPAARTAAAAGSSPAPRSRTAPRETSPEFRVAERNYKQALAIAESNEGPDHPRAAEIRMALGQLYYKEDRLADSERFFRRAIETLERVFGDDDLRYARALNNLAAVLARQERYSDAEALYNRALEIFRARLGGNHPYVGQTLTNLGKLHQARFSVAGETVNNRRNGDPAHRPPAPKARAAAGTPAATRKAPKRAAVGAPSGARNGADDAKKAPPEPPKKKKMLIVDEGASKMVSAKGNDAASADSKKLSYAWDLDGDGRYETAGQSVRFDASNIDGPRSLVLRVRVSDDDGGSVVGSIDALVRNVPPTADAGGPYEVAEGSSIEITATGNDAAPADRENLGYAWDLDGDGLFEASGKTVRFDASTIDGPKPVEIRLRVTDDDGGVAEVTTTVVVTNLPPRIEPAGQYTVQEGSTVRLRASASDPSPADARTLSYAWDLDGDGNFETRGMSPVFDAGGLDGPTKKIVRVRVTDDDGGSAVAPIEVRVTNAPPSLKVGGPYAVDEGGKVTLSAEGDDPSESDRGDLKYAWDLDGDGTFEVAGRTVEFDASAFDGPVTHAVSVKVTDDDGGSRVGSTNIAVRNLPPVLHKAEKFVVDEGGKVRLRIDASDPSAKDAKDLTYEWDLDGDGVFETTGASPLFDATGIDGPKLHTVKVRVSDDDGGAVEGEVVVEIRNVAPTSVTIEVGG